MIRYIPFKSWEMPTTFINDVMMITTHIHIHSIPFYFVEYCRSEMVNDWINCCIYLRKKIAYTHATESSVYVSLFDLNIALISTFQWNKFTLWTIGEQEKRKIANISLNSLCTLNNIFHKCIRCSQSFFSSLNSLSSGGIFMIAKWEKVKKVFCFSFFFSSLHC